MDWWVPEKVKKIKIHYMPPRVRFSLGVVRRIAHPAGLEEKKLSQAGGGRQGLGQQ